MKVTSEASENREDIPVRRLRDLSIQEVERRLKEEGLRWYTGPFSVALHARVPGFAKQILFLYRNHPVIDPPWRLPADLIIHLRRGKGFRRWFRPTIHFLPGGVSPFAPFPLDHALPLLEWGQNFCIASRMNHLLLFHAAVVEKKGVAFLFPGAPGAGKTTLSAALALSGWRFFSDEFGLMSLTTGELLPLARPAALKNKSIGVIEKFSSKAQLGPRFPRTRKGTVAHLRPPEKSVIAMHQRIKPGVIVFPQYDVQAKVSQFTPLQADHLFLRLASQSFNYDILGEEGFLRVVQMARTLPAFSLRYADLDDAIRALETMI
ncbi:HprK-related kinase A [Magnetococcales bacterium HHB-1]